VERGSVFVIGAGPAGLFAARKIAAAGHRVAIFNRDVKPGGLAEYGIYPQKFHMKGGLRKQFTKILDMPNVDYYGNLQIGEQAALSIAGLRHRAEFKHVERPGHKAWAELAEQYWPAMVHPHQERQQGQQR